MGKGFERIPGIFVSRERGERGEMVWEKRGCFDSDGVLGVFEEKSVRFMARR